MKRTGFDEHSDRQVANEFLAGHMQCRRCGNTAERETLSSYGGLCGGCYTDYVTGGRPIPPLPSPENRREILQRLRLVLDRRNQQDPREWARRLQRREEAGEPLSLFQRDAWRRALRVRALCDAEEVCHAA